MISIYVGKNDGIWKDYLDYCPINCFWLNFLLEFALLQRVNLIEKMQRFLYRSNHICSSLLRPHRGLQFLAGNVRMYATSEHVIDVNESNFDEYVVRSPVPVLVDVYAEYVVFRSLY